MHRTVVQRTDKYVLTALNRLFSDRNFPLMTFKNNFTNIFNNVMESRLQIHNPFAVNEYSKFDKCDKKLVAQTLADIFTLHPSKVNFILSNNVMFREITRRSLLNSYELLKNHGFTKQEIQDNMILLCEDYVVLQEKVNIVSQLTNNTVHAISLFYHDLNSLNSFVKIFKTRRISVQKQILLIQQNLQITNEDVFFIISKYLNRIIKQPEETIEKLKLLRSYGISVTSLLNDSWHLNCDIEKMKTRLQLCKDNLISPIKPRILICKQEFLDKEIEILRIKCMKYHQYALLIDFLSVKTGFSKEYIKIKVVKHLHMSMPYEEILDTIDVIIKEGYDYQDIICEIKVLTLSKDVINQRFSALKTINHKPPFLDVLLLSNSNFVKYVNNLKC